MRPDNDRHHKSHGACARLTLHVGAGAPAGGLTPLEEQVLRMRRGHKAQPAERLGDKACGNAAARSVLHALQRKLVHAHKARAEPACTAQEG